MLLKILCCFYLIVVNCKESVESFKVHREEVNLILILFPIYFI